MRRRDFIRGAFVGIAATVVGIPVPQVESAEIPTDIRLDLPYEKPPLWFHNEYQNISSFEANGREMLRRIHKLAVNAPVEHVTYPPMPRERWEWLLCLRDKASRS